MTNSTSLIETRARLSNDAPAIRATTIPSDLGEAQVKKNRPKDTRLWQQRLPAWQPILTAKTVIPIVFSISILFIPIGIVLFHTSQSVNEHIVFYVNASNSNCLTNHSEHSNMCSVPFTLEQKFEGDVYFYYGLENYFQNHRRYMKSRSDKQLLGTFMENKDTDGCAPYATDISTNKPFAPCGAIANSMFNDTFELHYQLDPQPEKIPWSYKELVWPIDMETKFKNPPCNGKPCETINELCDAFRKTVKPPNWPHEACYLDNSTVENSGFQNADFIIWMRTAALPDFRKPYRKLDRSASPIFTNGLPAGQYMLNVVNNYNVSSFGAKKWFVISTTSWMGGKNPFLGIAYIFVGVLCACLGVIFIFIHHKYGHTLQEMAGLEQPTRRSLRTQNTIRTQSTQ